MAQLALAATDWRRRRSPKKIIGREALLVGRHQVLWHKHDSMLHAAAEGFGADAGVLSAHWLQKLWDEDGVVVTVTEAER